MKCAKGGNLQGMQLNYLPLHKWLFLFALLMGGNKFRFHYFSV